MSILRTTNPLALQYLMTDDIYAIQDTPALSTASPILQVPETVDIPAAPSLDYFEYIGENNKYILIVIDDPAHANLPPKELEALLNILKAKKQELKDVAILNLHKYPTATFNSLKDFFACNSLILFGINPSQLQLEQIQANQISTIGQTRILATFSFTEMLDNLDKKRVFWEEMKKL